MKQWNTIFQKELIENWRNRKWIWVPLIIMLLTVMEPVTYYFLPDILDYAGGVPDGTVIEIPDMDASEMVMMSLESLSTYGILIIALFTMGTISNERKCGITEIILVKPIRYHHYISAKWAANLLLTLASLGFGLCLAWYYINLLFGKLPFSLLFYTFIFYGLWYSFVLTISIFYNTLFSTPGTVAACTIGTYFLMGAINTVIGTKWQWYPNQLSVHLNNMITTEAIPTDLWGTSFVILLFIVIIMGMAVVVFKQKEMV